MTVAAGFVQGVWTIGGTVPGPVIRVQVGDTVRIHLVNRPPKGSYPAAHPAVNDYPHAIGFRGSTGASIDQSAPLEPGEETSFAFKSERAGVWLYHGSTEPALQSIVNGMYGMLIVEPQGGLDEVAQEFFFVQGEWYLGGQYPPAPPLPSLAKAAAEVPAPDFVVLNGVADQYQDHPIQIATGERVRTFILNAGPNIDMSFRIEGTVFDRVIKEGAGLAVGNATGFASQAVDLAPGQGAIVEFTIGEDGMYSILTHPSGFAGRGATGVFRAGDGDPLN
jgi:nitrite reductase (NO-forming)